jgi:hypothetical protein
VELRGGSSAQTRKPDKVPGPKMCVRGTSAASRPCAMRTRPIRGALLRGSKVCHRPPRCRSHWFISAGKTYLKIAGRSRSANGINAPRRPDCLVLGRNQIARKSIAVTIMINLRGEHQIFANLLIIGIRKGRVALLENCRTGKKCPAPSALVLVPNINESNLPEFAIVLK